MALIVAALAVGAIAYALGRNGGRTPQAGDTPTTVALTSTSVGRSSTSEAPATTSTPRPTTSTTPASTQTSSTQAPATEVDAARSAAVVYFTYGTTAEGYPSFEEVIAPSAAPSVESMIIGPDYRNAGCYQIVKSIQEDPIPNPPTYGFDLHLAYRCPVDAPMSSTDGSPLPLTEDLYVEATVDPSPTGGYWATAIEIVGNN